MTRKSRPVRPPVPVAAGFKSLDKTHQEIMARLDDFGRLLEHVDEYGPDDKARAIATDLLAYFTGHAKEHHANEEAVVFPPLLQGPDEELAAHVRRLQQDHGWLEEDWLELAPQLEAISRGFNWYDLDMLRQALPIFSDLYRDHIALEEGVVYPAAKRAHQALAKGKAARGAGA
ncbi:MAG: hemerythrin domain-containing protein [Rubrivivax sp.]|nr:hemerythrin domain-containing protein [Rubrivivax sp.]MDH5340322.1 hemerythrin domain-containing protein [Rubrivivax sp.]